MSATGGSGGSTEPGGEKGPGGGDEVAGTSTIDMLAAALRADSQDLATYADVITTSLADALPAGMVEIGRDRSFGDRVAGRPGRATAITVHGDKVDLVLAAHPHGFTAQVVRRVRGVTIGTEEVTVDVWVRRLAEELDRLAQVNESTRQAVTRLLGA
ncbi:MAG: hypothetical protein M0020_00800 [Actinomycetota bacterium]|nr:hypothetical protein [Actinomycetota bacterium]